MSDIAMLVAEEYERRVKRSNNGSEEFGLSSFSSSICWMKKKKKNEGIGEEKLQIFNPKTQIGLAAIDGLFSA